jgi:Lon protease-like protein
LGGAILFPRSVLPLNIFEPRYLAMIEDALRADRMIGMIQPKGLATSDVHDSADPPELAEVGCLGRITSFQETDDNRYLIALKGVARFRVAEEIPATTPYRIVRPDWSEYAADLSLEHEATTGDRQELTAALNAYLETNGLNADWSAIKDAPADMLINSLSTGCPFTNSEKQALLEARTLQERMSALIALLMMERPGQGGGYVQ